MRLPRSYMTVISLEALRHWPPCLQHFGFLADSISRHLDSILQHLTVTVPIAEYFPYWYFVLGLIFSDQHSSSTSGSDSDSDIDAVECVVSTDVVVTGVGSLPTIQNWVTSKKGIQATPSVALSISQLLLFLISADYSTESEVSLDREKQTSHHSGRFNIRV
jgi:hypothetical protein